MATVIVEVDGKSGVQSDAFALVAEPVTSGHSDLGEIVTPPTSALADVVITGKGVSAPLYKWRGACGVDIFGEPSGPIVGVADGSDMNESFLSVAYLAVGCGCKRCRN